MERPVMHVMQKLIHGLAAALPLFALAACGGDEADPAARSLDAAIADSGAPIEGTSFRGTPLVRNPVDEARRQSIEAEIEALEGQDTLSEEDYILLGRRYIQANRFRDAVDLYSRGLEAWPDSFRLRRHRGHRYLNLRQLDLAIADLEEAVELIGGVYGDVLEYNDAGAATATYEHWVWYHIGLYHYLNEDWEQAAEAYQKCVDTAISNQNRVGATDWLYNALMQAGRRDDAQAAIDKIAPDLETNREHPYFKRVMLYKGELSPDDLLDTNKPIGDWTGYDITVGYGIGNWSRFNNDPATADDIQQKILETPFWNAWAYVVTDREASR